MQNSKSTIVGVIYLAASILLFFFLISGMFHACKKHSTIDGVASIVIPPWGIYRGIESFSHENTNAEEVAVDAPASPSK